MQPAALSLHAASKTFMCLQAAPKAKGKTAQPGPMVLIPLILFHASMQPHRHPCVVQAAPKGKGKKAAADKAEKEEEEAEEVPEGAEEPTADKSEPAAAVKKGGRAA